MEGTQHSMVSRVTTLYNALKKKKKAKKVDLILRVHIGRKYFLKLNRCCAGWNPNEAVSPLYSRVTVFHEIAS